MENIVFVKNLTKKEIEHGVITWKPDDDEIINKILPNTLTISVYLNDKFIENVTIDRSKRELNIGRYIENLMPGIEINLYRDQVNYDSNTIIIKTIEEFEKIIVKKRLSVKEFKNCYLKWYAREDDLYKRFLPEDEPLIIEINGKKYKTAAPNFEKRMLFIGECLRTFSPGETLILKWVIDGDTPTLRITRDESLNYPAKEAITSLRSLITRLISRPLSEFNEGEIKGLVLLLDENKQMWERLTQLTDENRKLKEQVALLENIIEQFSKNSFFIFKKEFEDWIVANLANFERGIRIIHKNYRFIDNDTNRYFSVDLLCQDKKGVLTACMIVFQPENKNISVTFETLKAFEKNLSAIADDLSEGSLKTASFRGIIFSSQEHPELVEQSLQRGYKLFIINSGYVIDTFE